MTFANPSYLLLLLLLIPMVLWYVWKLSKSQASLQISSSQGFDGIPVSARTRLRHMPFVCRLLAVAVLIAILARPQSSNHWQNTTTEGIDIVLALDISSSMLARDLTPNRLEAAKRVASDFVKNRPHDNIGLVIFAGESFTQCPLTTDHAILLNLFNQVKDGMIEDGTAIGNGLATAVNRIKDSEAKSKVIILLTDGSNNMGDVPPVTAAQLAAEFDIRVYTIGVGTKGEAPYPISTPFGIRYENMKVEIDEKTLTGISSATDGKYFRATDNRSLKAIYNEIDQLEKSKMTVKEYSKKQEEYLPLAIIAFLLILAEIVLKYTVLRNIP
jgi:Ca-activated chloride channel family protein